MILRQSLALVLCLASSYCYSEVITGSTENASAGAPVWNMGSVLPPESGLVVNGVAYRYTAVKDANDNFTVSIQNQNALGPGYIFQETDDWSALPGNTISKVVPVPGIPREAWGQGEIATTGFGTVRNPTVVYTYRYDTCFDPLTDPTCPGYAAAWAAMLEKLNLNPVIVIEDPLDNELVQQQLNRRPELDEDKTEAEKEEKEREEDKKKKLALKAAGYAVMTAEQLAASLLLGAMDEYRLQPYYNASQSGGVYPDSAQLVSTQLPENRKALRVGLAQQLLHTKIVDSQYKGK